MAAVSVLKKQVKKFVENASENDLKLIYNLFELNKKEDWWNEITKDHQQHIKEAIADANAGRTIPHADMVKQYKKWLKK
ncbi:MAG: hypothetical protein QM764_03530 [Chitinophagaceae bacterium]